MVNQIEKLQTLYMNINYHEFCRLINDGREDFWTEEKWIAWKEFNQSASKLGTLFNKLLEEN